MDEKRKITVKESETINELSLKSFETHLGFLKTIGAVSLTLFGIIVGLGGLYPHSEMMPSKEVPFLLFCLRLLYSLSLATLALGILGVYTCLYSFVLARRDLADRYAEALRKRISGDVSRENDIAVSAQGVSMFYTYAGKVGLLSLMVSIVCFAVYAVVAVWI